MRTLNLQGRVVKVTRRQPGLKCFKQRGENLRLTIPEPDAINQTWVADIIYIKVKDCYKFLSVIMDLYSRRILSWSLTHTRTTQDTAKVLNSYINHFYNKKRLHSGISYCSPVEYEMMST